LNKKTTEILIIVIKVLAVLGFILTFLSLGGRTYGLRLPNRNNYAVIISVIMILPFLIYFFSSKQKLKKVLKSNFIDLNKVGLTNMEYFEKKSKKNIFEIYVKNETSDTLIVNRNSLLEHNSWYVFTTDKYNPIHFSNGIEFHIDKELNLEIIDFRNQIIGLGDDYFKKHDVPKYVNWSFIIAESNQEDSIE
jgi:hypothetical protein